MHEVLLFEGIKEAAEASHDFLYARFGCNTIIIIVLVVRGYQVKHFITWTNINQYHDRIQRPESAQNAQWVQALGRLYLVELLSSAASLMPSNSSTSCT